MSVYKRSPKAKTYSYDFVYRGHRFSGDTGHTSKREAERFEQARRQEAIGHLAATGGRRSAELSFEEAVSRYWAEVGQYHVNASTTLSNLEWLLSVLDRKTLLSSIDDDLVAKAVSVRRSMIRRVGKEGEPQRRVSPATVNRTALEPLRKVMRRASEIWKVRTGEVAWGTHRLAEPQERVREASLEEEKAILAQLGNGYDVTLRFALLTGCRRQEILDLTWDRVDFRGRVLSVVGKGDKQRYIPMSQAVYDLLTGERGHHEKYVFTYEAQRTKAAQSITKGERYPLTAEGLKSAWQRAVKRAGIADFRFHDARHTAATRILRASNLRVAQQLLGHSDVATTTKYAHVLTDDIRDAMERAVPRGGRPGGSAYDPKRFRIR